MPKHYHQKRVSLGCSAAAAVFHGVDRLRRRVPLAAGCGRLKRAVDCRRCVRTLTSGPGLLGRRSHKAERGDLQQLQQPCTSVSKSMEKSMCRGQHDFMSCTNSHWERCLAPGCSTKHGHDLIRTAKPQPHQCICQKQGLAAIQAVQAPAWLPLLISLCPP